MALNPNEQVMLGDVLATSRIILERLHEQDEALSALRREVDEINRLKNNTQSALRVVLKLAGALGIGSFIESKVKFWQSFFT